MAVSPVGEGQGGAARREKVKAPRMSGAPQGGGTGRERLFAAGRSRMEKQEIPFPLRQSC
jgi:hypothetical protein